jgi:hypothetical protein
MLHDQAVNLPEQVLTDRVDVQFQGTIIFSLVNG